jgi:eukaryotic-like serine/threonine-protein kinase
MTLAELIQSNGPLPPARVVYFLRQVCASLRAAHAAGLIHRDIKPGNLNCSVRGGQYDVVKILDFGLVWDRVDDRSAADRAGAKQGSILELGLFLSPDQVTCGAEVDARSDIYSLGATAYFLLTGRPPFERSRLPELLMAHTRDPVVPPSSLVPAMPDDIDRIVLRCLEKEPGRRFQSAEELDDALTQCRCARDWTPADARRWWSDHGK